MGTASVYSFFSRGESKENAVKISWHRSPTCASVLCISTRYPVLLVTMVLPYLSVMSPRCAGSCTESVRRDSMMFLASSPPDICMAYNLATITVAIRTVTIYKVKRRLFLRCFNLLHFFPVYHRIKKRHNQHAVHGISPQERHGAYAPGSAV